MIGSNGKKYHVHGSAISRLSKPLAVLINGDMREAKEKLVQWPDIDEKTFVRFTQWAYTETYMTEEPDIVLDASLIHAATHITVAQVPPKCKSTEKPLYSLVTANLSHSWSKDCCQNKNCVWYGKINLNSNYQATCLACRRVYTAKACASCNSVYTDCPTCGPLNKTSRQQCSNGNCNYGYGYGLGAGNTHGQLTCPRCFTSYSTKMCSCQSAFSDCRICATLNEKPTLSKKYELIRKFLDETGIVYPNSTPVFSPRNNAEGREDYTEVFLCHAKLYVVADTYDIPSLKQLSLHRLHVTLKEFTLYPSRMEDIATLARYVFENTLPEEKIRDMITLYYACIVEDAQKHDGLESLIKEIPDFAFGLINRLSDRLA